MTAILEFHFDVKTKKINPKNNTNTNNYIIIEKLILEWQLQNLEWSRLIWQSK